GRDLRRRPSAAHHGPGVARCPGRRGDPGGARDLRRREDPARHRALTRRTRPSTPGYIPSAGGAGTQTAGGIDRPRSRVLPPRGRGPPLATRRGMLARVFSACLAGVDAALVRVEVDVSQGLPTFATVGLPDPAVRESRERVRTAIRNSGFAFPLERVTVNLAPADLRKEGVSFDLPIALGLLAATGAVKPDRLARLLVVGELALDGAIHPVKGALPMALRASHARLDGCLFAAGNASEAALLESLAV